jgi:hypothetical protein
LCGDVKAVKASISRLNGGISTKESNDSRENSFYDIKQKKSADEDMPLKIDKLPINKEHLIADKYDNTPLSLILIITRMIKAVGCIIIVLLELIRIFGILVEIDTECKFFTSDFTGNDQDI